MAGALADAPKLVWARDEGAFLVPALYPGYAIIKAEETNFDVSTFIVLDDAVLLTCFVSVLQHIALQNT